MHTINEFNNSKVGQQQNVVRKNLPNLLACVCIIAGVMTLVIQAI